MKFLLLSILISILILCGNVYPYGVTPRISDGEYYTDKALKELAIKKGVIPEGADAVYFKEQLAQQNSVTAWILVEREGKIQTVDKLKSMFLEQKSVKINKPSEYYVDEINGVIYNSTKGDEYFSTAKKGVGIIFRTIAIQEGDYTPGDGRSKVVILKDFFGERFEWYKKTFPAKYEYLIKLDKEK